MFKVPGETDNTLEVPAPIRTAPEVSVAAPVPPPATPNVPLRVRVPAPVIGPPEKESPLIAVVALTEVTVPPPPLVAAILIEPEPFVIVIPEPAVNVVLVSVLPVELPISN